MSDERRFPASPSKHCPPSPPLPPSPRLRKRTTFVPASTHPMARLPPHTTTERELRKAIYGERPKGGWCGFRGGCGSAQGDRGVMEPAAERGEGKKTMVQWVGSARRGQ